MFSSFADIQKQTEDGRQLFDIAKEEVEKFRSEHGGSAPSPEEKADILKRVRERRKAEIPDFYEPVK